MTTKHAKESPKTETAEQAKAARLRDADEAYAGPDTSKIPDVIESSDDAAATRQDADVAGANASHAKRADEATPIAFAPNEVPTNQAAVENLATQESRLRAKLVGESAVAQAQVGATPNRAQVREVQIPGTQQTYQEVVLPASNGIEEIVITPLDTGDVEIYTHDASRVNDIRNRDVRQGFVTMSADDWAMVTKTVKSRGSAKPGAAPAESAAEQRAGASSEGEPVPVAPTPVVL